MPAPAKVQPRQLTASEVWPLIVTVLDWAPLFFHYFNLPLTWSCANIVKACRYLCPIISNVLVVVLQHIRDWDPPPRLALICTRARQSAVSVSLALLPLILLAAFQTLRLIKWLFYTVVSSIQDFFWRSIPSFILTYCYLLFLVGFIWITVALFLVANTASRQQRLQKFLEGHSLEKTRSALEARIPREMASIGKGHTTATHKRKKDHWLRHVKKPLIRFKKAQEKELDRFIKAFPGQLPPEWLVLPLCIPPSPQNPSQDVKAPPLSPPSCQRSTVSVGPACVQAGGPLTFGLSTVEGTDSAETPPAPVSKSSNAMTVPEETTTDTQTPSTSDGSLADKPAPNKTHGRLPPRSKFTGFDVHVSSSPLNATDMDKYLQAAAAAAVKRAAQSGPTAAADAPPAKKQRRSNKGRQTTNKPGKRPAQSTNGPGGPAAVEDPQDATSKKQKLLIDDEATRLMAFILKGVKEWPVMRNFVDFSNQVHRHKQCLFEPVLTNAASPLLHHIQRAKRATARTKSRPSSFSVLLPGHVAERPKIELFLLAYFYGLVKKEGEDAATSRLRSWLVNTDDDLMKRVCGRKFCINPWHILPNDVDTNCDGDCHERSSIDDEVPFLCEGGICLLQNYHLRDIDVAVANFQLLFQVDAFDPNSLTSAFYGGIGMAERLLHMSLDADDLTIRSFDNKNRLLKKPIQHIIDNLPDLLANEPIMVDDVDKQFQWFIDNYHKIDSTPRSLSFQA